MDFDLKLDLPGTGLASKACSNLIYFEIEPQNWSPQIEVRFWKINLKVKPFQLDFENLWLRKSNSIEIKPQLTLYYN